MLIKLEYSNTFPSTGRTLAESVTFEKGFGTITGHNEAGKSFLLEMIRWLLFGVKALRGNADDYRKLRGELTFAPRGEVYRVVRTISSATLYRGDEEVAVGTRAVNMKIVNILGYGLEVFDVANAAGQGDLEALSSLRPEKRKRLVDSVIGLGVIEDLAKSAGDEANALSRRVEDLKNSIREPEQPVKPEGYRPSSQLAEELRSLRVLKAEMDRLEGILLAGDPREPVKPTCSVQVDSADLKPLVEQQAARKAELAELRRRLAAIPTPSPYSEEQLVTCEKYLEARRFLDAHPEPDFTSEQLDRAELWIADYNRHLDRQHVAQMLSRQGSHTCPKCAHHWYEDQKRADDLKAQLDSLDEVPAEHQVVPNISEFEIAAKRQQLARYEEVSPQIETYQLVVAVPRPDLTEAEIVEHRRRNAEAAQRGTIQDKIVALDREEPDYQAMWMERSRYEVVFEKYKADLLTYQERQAEIQKARLRISIISPQVEGIETLDRQYSEALLFETRWDEYQKQLETFQQQQETIREIESECEDWRKARMALTNLRAMVKQHLIPSLNKVASSMIFNMTGGQRRLIEVDDDFNITVDGQPINTLSGSGKAVANLALRLGLGQVLTNNVLSVFIGDEIDGSMDKDRAENTSRTLQTLKNNISQILLITHKYPVADYYISLGNKNEYPDQRGSVDPGDNA